MRGMILLGGLALGASNAGIGGGGP